MHAEPATVVVDLEARETDWAIRPDLTVRGWGFNGLVPGPTLEARAGDTLVVYLKNRLPEPTTIHWHGLRIPAPMDGTEMTQRVVKPGGAFEYRFVLPDAGTYWYHPHANETVQMERGLYGAIVVRGADDPVVDAERVIVLDDVSVDRRGRIAKPGGVLERHNGRQGGIPVLNGQADVELSMPAGQIARWRIVNAGSARYVRLSIGGRPFRIIGTDGGLIERPIEATDVVVAPGDRVDLAVGPFVEGDELGIDALPHHRRLGQRRRTERFGVLRVGPLRPSRAVIPDRLRTIEPLVTGPVEPTRDVRLGGRLSLRRGVDFLVNDHQHHHDDPVKVGELQIWQVINETPMDHPFHLHGFFFQVLDVNGDPPPVRSWEDTVNVPAKGRVRIAWLPDDRPGPWMYHCHILEHMAAGMMAHFEVVR